MVGFRRSIALALVLLVSVSIGPLRYLLNNPAMHIWHHVHGDSGPVNRNFGITLSLWDWLFGSAHVPDRPPDRLGFERIEFAGDIQWSGVKTKYFLAAMLPEDGSQVVTGFFHPGGEAIGMAIETAGVGTHRYMVYAGPLDHARLKSLGYGLERAVDFGWKWIKPLSQLMFRFILFCHKYIPNYGLVIEIGEPL